MSKAQSDLLHKPYADRSVIELNRRGGSLAVIQALQLGIGLLGQFWLLTRWSSKSETDVLLLLSSIPWVVGAIMLIGGLDLFLPATLYRVIQGKELDVREHFLEQVTGLTVLAALFATLVSGSVITVWGIRLGVPAVYALVMGAALGGQLLPFALADLWRGYLVAKNQVVRARLTLLVGSIVTTVGYGAAIGPSSIALSLVMLGAMTSVALTAWILCRIDNRAMPNLQRCFRAVYQPWHPEIVHLLSNLVAMGVAAGLLHAETLVMRAAVLPLGTGTVTALSVAHRGWDALLTLIVAASTLPVYPHWARGQATSPSLFRWTLLRTWGFTLAVAVIVGGVFRCLGPWLVQFTLQPSIAKGIQMAWVLLPRFILLSGIQPLVMRHYAAGSPWHPVLASALGLTVLSATLPVFVPRWGFMGLAAALVLGVIPGWVYLGWRVWREVQQCAS